MFDTPQVKKRFLISGGGAAETEVAMRLTEWSKTQTGMRGYCIRAYGEGERKGARERDEGESAHCNYVCVCVFFFFFCASTPALSGSSLPLPAAATVGRCVW